MCVDGYICHSRLSCCPFRHSLPRSPARARYPFLWLCHHVSLRVCTSPSRYSLRILALSIVFSLSHFPFLSPCRFRSRSLAFSLSFSPCTHARSPLLTLAPAAHFHPLSSYTLSLRLSLLHPRCEKSHSGRPRTCRFPNLGARQAEGL